MDVISAIVSSIATVLGVVIINSFLTTFSANLGGAAAILSVVSTVLGAALILYILVTAFRR